MVDLVGLAARVAAPEPVAGGPVPPGPGRIGELAGWLGGVQGSWPPVEPRRVVLLAVTDDPAAPLGPAVAEVADLAAVQVRAVPLPPAVAETAGADGADGAGAAETAGAGGAGGVDAAAAAGVAAVDRAVDEGADLLVVVGAGAAVPVAGLIAVLGDLEPAEAVVAADDAAWRRDVLAVRNLLRRARPHAHAPVELLSTVDSPVPAVLVGLLLQAAARRTPVLLDGMVSCVAAVAAHRLAPAASGWWLVADKAGTPAHRAALDQLGLAPVLELGAPRGCAGPLLVPLLRAAARLSTCDADASRSGPALPP